MKTLENVVVLSLEDYEQLMKNQKQEELEIGKWYKCTDRENSFVLKKDKQVGYGFWVGSYGLKWSCSNIIIWEKASPIEIYKALKKHAISLGFEGDFSFNEYIPNEFKCDGKTIFKDGIWEKPKDKIDYSMLKTGSFVKLKRSSQICDYSDGIDYEKEFKVVFYKTKHYFTCDGVFHDENGNKDYCTFYQDGNFALFASHSKIDYITEVISY